MVRQGKEAVGVWKSYFQNVLNEGEDQRFREMKGEKR